MEKIAILGMGCLFPGNSTKEEFWQKIVANTTLTSIDYYLDREIERGKVDPYTKSLAAFGSEDQRFDQLGDIYKWILSVCGEALAESGYLQRKEPLAKTGLIMGTLGMPVREDADLMSPFVALNVESIVRTLLQHDQVKITIPPHNPNLSAQAAFSESLPPGLIASLLGLGGPVFSFNAACSTPLYAFKLASYYLSAGQVEMMLVGSHCYNELVIGNCGLFDVLGVLSEKGQSRPLDATSQGLIAGSGAGAFLLKRYKQAVRDQDPILAIVESIGWSNDGGSKSILAPALEGQVKAYQHAYSQGVLPQVDYVECHATGTRAGDQTEVDSLATFFKQYQVKPYIGALKGSTGHFFTASANASIAKVILAMQHNLIPATIRVDQPVTSSDGYLDAAHFVTNNTSWPQQSNKKRGAVNAFGFGGINAHMVLSEHLPGEAAPEQQAPTPRPAPVNLGLAIVGMGVHIGEADSLKKFYDALVKNAPVFNEPDEERWRNRQQLASFTQPAVFASFPKGAYINTFPFDFLKYKIPPNENPYFIRRDLLLLTVAAQALEDAGITPGSAKRTAVIVNCTQDYSDQFMVTEEHKKEIMASLEATCPSLNERQRQEIFAILRETERDREQTPYGVTGIIPNIRANRISAYWKFEGPSFILLERENATARALELARFLLSEGLLDCVVIGGVEFGGELEHLYIQKQLGLYDQLLQTGIGEGAVVLVLKTAEKAREEGDRIYAIVDGVALSGGKALDLGNPAELEAAAQDCIAHAVEQAGVEQYEIGYVEMATFLSKEAPAWIKRVYTEQYPQLLSPNDCPTGSVESVIGHAFSLTALAGLVKSALQLYYKVKCPAQPDEKVKAWLSKGKKRVAAVASKTSNSNWSQLILSESPSLAAKELGKVENIRSFLLPVQAEDESELLGKLAGLMGELKAAKQLKSLVYRYINQFKKNRRAEALTFALVGDSVESLVEEAQSLANAVPDVIRSGGAWTSNRGSCFTAKPVGEEKKLVWMAPPGRMIKGEMVCDMLSIFPDLRGIFSQDAGYASYDGPNDWDAFGKNYDTAVIADYLFELPLTKMTVTVLRDRIGLQPAIVIGASFGEIALLNALDGLTSSDAEVKEGNALLVSKLDTFIHLFDNQAVFEKYFNQPVEAWQSWYVKAPQEMVRQCVDAEAMVFVSIIGSPTDVVISGEKNACQRVLDKVGGFAIPMEENSSVHTPVANAFYDSIYRMGIEMGLKLRDSFKPCAISTPLATPYQGSTEFLARNLAAIICQPVDFERVTRLAYEAGGRVFIDTGTNNVCSQWVSETLKGQDVLVLSVHQVQNTVETNLLLLLAKLVAYNIPVNLDPFFPFKEEDGAVKPSLIREVSAGLPSTERLIDQDTYRQRLRQLETKRVINAPTPDYWDEEERGNDQPPLLPAQPGYASFAPTAALDREAEVSIAGVEDSAMAWTPHHFTLQAYKQNYEAMRLYQQMERSLFALFQDTIAASSPLQPLPDRAKLSSPALPATNDSSALQPVHRQCLWNDEQILEMTHGKMATVLGPEYEGVDRYAVRARMPSPPFLFVSRITKIQAQFGRYEPCLIEMEYDLTEDCIFAMNEHVSSVVFSESGQIGIFLVGCLGIDITSNGKLRYRIADTKTTFFDELPKVGSTFRGVFEITLFAKNGDTTLVFSTYQCYQGPNLDKLFMQVNGIGGFFTEQDLKSSKGITRKSPSREAISRAGLPIQPFRLCPQQRFDETALQHFYDGRLDLCFDEPLYQAAGLTKGKTSAFVRMIDRITHIALTGGDYGLGYLTAEKEIATDHWAFDAHFKNDSVFPGSLMIDGISQLLLFYVFYLGVPLKYVGKTVGILKNATTSTSFRGQVERIPSRFLYTVHVKKIDLGENLTITADAYLEWEGKTVLHSENYVVAIQ